MKFIISIIIIFQLSFTANAGGGYFVANKGQLPKEVLFHAKLNSGDFYIVKNGFKIKVLDPVKLKEVWGHPEHDSRESDHKNHKSFFHSKMIDGHSFLLEITNATLLQKNAVILNSLNHKINKLIGTDTTKWATNLTPVTDLLITSVKPGVDLRLFFKENSIKYEFILNKKTGPIIIKYNGVKTAYSKSQITVNTEVGIITDEQPVSFSKKHPKNKIKTAFQKLGLNTYQILPEAITEYPFVIDPQLNFATFSGATIDNWGYTATYDDDGYAYGGGIDFSGGYPTSTGAFQESYGGGDIDMAISKFSPDGKELIYATYIGGSGIEAPHSMVVNGKNELVIYGVTSSSNYPTTPGAYDLTFNGGSFVSVSNVLDFTGSDIVLTVLNNEGNKIIGSTYYGGTQNDALNDAEEVAGLYRNYADLYRGEVTVDGNDNIFVSSVTESTDLPTPGGFQTNYGGGTQDGCVAKFNSNLTNIIWGSYYGGSGADACYASKQNSKGETYITGGTTSEDLPNQISGAPSSSGINGYLAKISANGSTLTSSRFIATQAYDQSYFVEVDYDDDVYCFGQTLGDMPITSGVYSNSNSGQFLQKYSGNLQNLLAATTIGNGNNGTNIVPSALMVSNCKEVYISGWGGLVNGDTKGVKDMPITSGAVQSSTDGSDFYFMLLGQNFSSLKYATFFGGSDIYEHVDGGTSRFDRNGTIYQAVCGGCGGLSSFPTTPQAYSQNNGSQNCNLAVIKMDISKLTANIQFRKDSTHCINEPIQFYNESTGGLEYKWIFPDGSTSQDYDAEYYFPETGNYKVKLIAIDSTQCPYADTAEIGVEVITIPEITIDLDTFLCNSGNLSISVIGGPNDENYRWWTEVKALNSNTNLINVSPDKTTDYFASYQNKCGIDTTEITIPVYYVPESNTFFDSVCSWEDFEVYYPLQGSTTLREQNNQPYSYSQDTLKISMQNDASYIFIKEGSCGIGIDTFNLENIEVKYEKSNDTTVCAGTRARININTSNNINWTSPLLYDSTRTNNAQFLNPTSSNYYPFTVSFGGCEMQDTVEVSVFPRPYQQIEKDYTIDFGEKIDLQLNPNYKYEWTPNRYLDCNNCASIRTEPQEDINYKIRYVDSIGCVVIDSIDINVIFPLYIPNVFTPNGDSKNDIFYAYTFNVDDFEMRIYNRWGELIFISEDKDYGWDGTVNGTPQQQDTYVYRVVYTPAHTETNKTLIGRVTLLR